MVQDLFALVSGPIVLGSGEGGQDVNHPPSSELSCLWSCMLVCLFERKLAVRDKETVGSFRWVIKHFAHGVNNLFVLNFHDDFILYTFNMLHFRRLEQCLALRWKLICVQLLCLSLT